MKPGWMRILDAGAVKTAVAVVLYAAGLQMPAIASSAAASCPIPLEKGIQWTYEGEVRWTVTGSAKVKAAHIQWTTEVVDCVKGSGVEAAVIRGFPTELAWYEPGQTPGFCVLLSVSNRVYRLGTQGEKPARLLAQQLAASPRRRAKAAEELLELPLAVGRKWDQEPARDDTWYCWCVEQAQAKPLRVRGFSSPRPLKTYTLAYRTCPDHQLLDIVPGLGIVRFIYCHHGTVASADMRLVSFDRSGGSSGQRKPSG